MTRGLWKPQRTSITPQEERDADIHVLYVRDWNGDVGREDYFEIDINHSTKETQISYNMSFENVKAIRDKLTERTKGLEFDDIIFLGDFDWFRDSGFGIDEMHFLYSRFMKMNRKDVYFIIKDM